MADGLWLGVWLFLTGAPQQGPTQPPPVPPVVAVSVIVTAPRAPSGQTVLDAETLGALAGVALDEKLRTVAGFSLFRRSSSRATNPTTHGVTMRGLSASGASRGLVLLEGIPLNDGFGAWVTWTRVPGAALDRVDVQPGPSADLFGSDALGGVVRLQAIRPERAQGLLSGALGSHHTRMIDASAGTRLDRVTVFGAASYLETAGTIPLEPASAGPVDRPADAAWWNGFGRATTAGSGRRWSLYGYGGRDTRGNGTVAQRNRMAGGTVAGAFEATTDTSTLAARVSVSPNRFDQTFTAVAAGRVSESVTNVQRIESTTTRAVVEVGRSWTRGYAIVRGAANWAAADFSETRATGTTTSHLVDNSEGVSAQAAWTGHAAVTIGVGARVEWRAAPVSGSARDRAQVGRVTVRWQPTPAVGLQGSASTSHRWPTLNELSRGFRVGSAVTLANPDLEPERARSVEGGATLQGARGRVSLTAFHTVVADAIANVTLPSLTGIVRQRRNAGDAVASGAEILTEVAVGDWARVTGGLVLVDATFRRSQEPAIDGRQLPQVPRVSGTVAAFVGTGALSGSLLVRSVGHQFDDDRNAFRLAPATTVDGTITARLGRLRVSVVVENALDARVETGRTPLVSLAPGRAARLGLSLSFGGFRR